MFHRAGRSAYNGVVDTAQTSRIIERAWELGFAAGIAAISPMDPAPFRAWLEAGYAAEMTYLTRHLPLRADLRAVLAGARSAICVALPYPDGESAVGAVAKYARGVDYHDVVRERLTTLWDELRREHSGAKGRVFVDSGPLPERELARRAGLGCIGKHGCLIHPEWGSRVVLGEILTTLELEPTALINGSCGACRRCLDACPTGALVAPGIVDARRCLSYLTIEHKGLLPRELRSLLGTRLFGCDACQDACPRNRAQDNSDSPLTPAPYLLAPDLPALLMMPAKEFTGRFHGTALHRAKRRGVLRNACAALGNLGDPASIPALRHALHDPEPLVRGHAAWALGRLGEREILEAALGDEANQWVREEIRAGL